MTLLLSPLPGERGLGLACAVGVVVAAAFVLLVLPAAPRQLDRWIFWPKVRVRARLPGADGHSLWRRVGDRVAATRRDHQRTLVALAVMAAGIAAIDTG